jgi:hypothetical protein
LFRNAGSEYKMDQVNDDVSKEKAIGEPVSPACGSHFPEGASGASWVDVDYSVLMHRKAQQ